MEATRIVFFVFETVVRVVSTTVEFVVADLLKRLLERTEPYRTIRNAYLRDQMLE